MFVNAIMYYKVKDATSAVANVDDYSGSAQLLAATTLRNVLGTRNLGDILSEREAIASEMQVTNRNNKLTNKQTSHGSLVLTRQQTRGASLWNGWR